MVKIDPIENYTGQFGLTMMCLHYSGFSPRVFLKFYTLDGVKGFMKIALMIFQKHCMWQIGRFKQSCFLMQFYGINKVELS